MKARILPRSIPDFKMAQRYYSIRTVLFLIVGAILVVALDFAFVPGHDKKSAGPVPDEKTVAIETEIPPPPTPIILGEQLKPLFAPPMSVNAPKPVLPQVVEPPAWKKNAVPTLVPKNVPRVALIIDDMGLDIKHTREAMDLPGPLTMAFLPYAKNLSRQTSYAISKGHELMVHVPMEPGNKKVNAGPDVLRVAQTPEEFASTLERDLSAFEGYVGVNNHMGSKMTQDPGGMARLMAELKKRGLLFIDSKTIGTSVAADEAKKAGIPYGARNIFLDDDESGKAIEGSLEQVEKYALKHGVAIAIGHPRKETLLLLKDWLPKLKEKGIELIPVSAAVIPPPPEEPLEIMLPQAAQ